VFSHVSIEGKIDMLEFEDFAQDMINGMELTETKKLYTSPRYPKCGMG